MNDRDLTELFAATDPGDEPALPATFAEATLFRARRSVARRRVAGVAALVLVVGAILGVAPWRSQPAEPSPAEPSPTDSTDPSGPSLPAQFPELSRGTPMAIDQPLGRAIALYEYGDSDGPWQTLVAGADRDTYRRVDRADDVSPDVLLSPDGRHVLYFKASRGTDEFTLLDLATGRTEVRHSVEWMSNVGASITMLDWSPDGRYVAYAVPHPPPGDGRAESSLRGAISLRDVAILDVVNDTNVLFSLNTPVFGAAFSPDSQQVAVLGDPESPILSVAGELVGTWSAPSMPIANLSRDWVVPVAWSPDGRLLAVGLPPRSVSFGVASYNGPDTAPIVFVDLTGTGPAARTDVTGYLLGWRSPTSIVVSTVVDADRPHGDSGVQVLQELSIVDGMSTVLSRFHREDNCRFTGRCTLYSVQLARNLLPEIGIRPGGSTAGRPGMLPGVGSALVAVTIVAVIIAAIAAMAVLRRRRLP